MHKQFRRLCLALAALIAAGTLLAALIPAAEAVTYKKGSSGAVVSQIQTKLKNWGYYTGDVDGVYGSATERAVRAFQRKNGSQPTGKPVRRHWRRWDCRRTAAEIRAAPAA